MSTHTSRHHRAAPRLALLIQALLLPSAALAVTEEVVGTWRKSDRSLVEFKPDGSVTAGSMPVGRWERLRDSTKYVLRFNGADHRIFYYVTTGRYKRSLSVEVPSNGSRSHMDREDNGPTVNPDVPDEREALEMEYTDAVASIERTSEALSRAQAEAAEAWQKHYYARSIGRISAWIPVAQRKEAEARGLESSLNSQRASLKRLAVKLGKPEPTLAANGPGAVPVFQPMPGQATGRPTALPEFQPMPGQTTSRQPTTRRSPQGLGPAGGPQYVPGQPMPGNFVPGQPMHVRIDPVTGQPIFTR